MSDEPRVLNALQQQLLEAIRNLADPETRLAPPLLEFSARSGIKRSRIDTLFGGYPAAVREAGCVPRYRRDELGPDFVSRRRRRKPRPRPAPGPADPRTECSAPLASRWMRYAPCNEQGVVLLFGMLAPRLGFAVEAAQTAFPDCRALRETRPGVWQVVRIEFEYESRNFGLHGHPPDGCDLIVCWRHNWPACPATLEVLELEPLMDKLAAESESSCGDSGRCL